MPKLFVVAPHSHCDSQNPNRHCDRVALAAVNEIIAYDTPNRFISDSLTADKLRTMNHDYNRPNTNKTAWRQDLQSRIRRDKPDFVFEIHSFPGNHEMYQRLWHGADLAIFASEHNKLWVNDLAAKIKARVPAEYRIEIVKPWHPVSITDDMNAIRASQPECARLLHSLFEFNEDMPDERIRVLARAVYNASLEIVEQYAVSGGIMNFDTATTHPGSIEHFAVQKNASKLKILLVVFLLLSLILIGLGCAIITRGFDTMFPQLRGWVPYQAF